MYEIQVIKRPYLLGNKRRLGKIPWNKGKKGLYKASEETRKKLSVVRLGNKYRLGKTPWNKGKKMPQFSGENHPNWKGGVAKDKRKRGEYTKWRSQVFERDNWTCQTCHTRGCYLEAHHIKAWSKYPELRFDPSNGVTLCEDCHKLTDNYKGRK
jgi:hypothetical protein